MSGLIFGVYNLKSDRDYHSSTLIDPFIMYTLIVPGWNSFVPSELP